MGEIPKDIWDAAYDAWEPQSCTPGSIARAILAERKRCAEVVRNTRHAEFYGNPDQMHAASFIAQAIEAGA